MGRSNTDYRTFTEDYRKYAESHRHGWPPVSLVQKWFAVAGSNTGAMCSAIRNGKPVPSKFAEWLVSLLAGDDRIKDIDATREELQWLAEARQVAATFLTRFGITEVTPDTAEAAIEHLCYPAISAEFAAEGYKDYLRYRVDVFASILFKAEYPDWVHGCKPTQVQEIVRWMYTRVGHEVAPKGRLLAPDQARKAAAAYMDVDEDGYCERVGRWRAAHPWSVVRAWHRHAGAVGMSIALPVTDAAYSEIVEGRLTPYNCVKEHLSPSSLNIVLEAMAEDPRYVGCSKPNPTESLRAGSVFQIAALARTNRLDRASEVRILGFAGTPENEGRMQKVGFVRTPHFMRHRNPNTRLAIYELKIKVHQLVSASFLEAASLDHAGKHLPATPPLDGA